jgi:putative MATE family efflux protein
MTSTALTAGFGLIDMGFISRIGTDAVAAVAAASSILRITMGAGEGIRAAVLAMTARFFGRKDRSGISRTGSWGLVLALLSGMIIFILLLIFRFPLMGFFEGSEEFRTGGAEYLTYVGLGSVFLFLYLAAGAVFHGCGNTKLPLIIIAAANLVNVIMDPLLIFGVEPFPEMGIAGAGLATLLGNLTGALLAVTLLFKSAGPLPPFRLRFSRSKAVFQDIVRISLPAAGQMSTRPVSGMLLIRMVSSFGTAPVAAFGIGLRLTSFCAVFTTGLSAAVAALTGQSLGRENLAGAKDALRLGIRLGTAIFIGIGAVFFFLPAPLLAFFRPDAPVLVHGIRYLRILAPSLLFLGAMGSLQGIFRGSGDTPALIETSLLANFPGKLGGAFLLAFLWPASAYGIWLGIALSIVLETLLLVLWYKTGRWHKRKTVTAESV